MNINQQISNLTNQIQTLNSQRMNAPSAERPAIAQRMNALLAQRSSLIEQRQAGGTITTTGGPETATELALSLPVIGSIPKWSVGVIAAGAFWFFFMRKRR